MALTQEQIKNWRQVLFFSIGPYALLVPDEEIQALRYALQGAINQDDEERRREAAKEYRERKERVVREGREKVRNDRLASLTSRVLDAIE
jgi:hypothetical protein